MTSLFKTFTFFALVTLTACATGRPSTPVEDTPGRPSTPEDTPDATLDDHVSAYCLHTEECSEEPYISFEECVEWLSPSLLETYDIFVAHGGPECGQAYLNYFTCYFEAKVDAGVCEDADFDEFAVCKVERSELVDVCNITFIW